MTGPADVTANYTALMRERGWGWDDLADSFLKQAEQPSLDNGAGALSMARWARSNADAARQRQAAAEDADRPDPGAPERATPPKKRTAVAPPAPARRSSTAASAVDAAAVTAAAADASGPADGDSSGD